MKAIFLISSIFYIIGLKVSSNIELTLKKNPVDTLISNKIIPPQPAKSVHLFQPEENIGGMDSLKAEKAEKEEYNSL